MSIERLRHGDLTTLDEVIETLMSSQTLEKSRDAQGKDDNAPQGIGQRLPVTELVLAQENFKGRHERDENKEKHDR